MASFSTYTIYARFFPAIISALPLAVLWFFLSDLKELSNLVSFVLQFKFLGELSFSLVFLYLYAQIIRTTSKFLEERYFTKAKGFPTTYLMSYENRVFSESYKDKYRERIASCFNLELLDADKEKEEPEEAKKRLDEVVKHVILKVGDGKLVGKHNIWYGFFRNLIGGSFYSTTFCLLNIGVGYFLINNPILVIPSGVILILNATILFFRKKILIQNGEAYAKQLIAEFMSQG